MEQSGEASSKRPFGEDLLRVVYSVERIHLLFYELLSRTEQTK